MTVQGLIDALSKFEPSERVAVVTDGELKYPMDIEDVILVSGTNTGYVVLSTDLKLGE